MDGMTAVPAGTVPDFWILMVKTLGGLALVLGLLMGVLYLLKHLTKPQRGVKGKGMIRLVSSFYLAPRERLHLMDVMGRKILIGVTPQGITRITEFTDFDAECGEMAEEPQGTVQDSLFKNLITRISRETGQRIKAPSALQSR